MASNEDLVRRYQDGDYMVLDELTKQNLNLIKFVAGKFYINCNCIDREDLEQQGWIGFLRAVETYKVDHPKCAKFSTWAIYWIRQSVQRYLGQKTPKGEVSLSAPIGDSDSVLEDTIEDPDAEIMIFHRAEREELHRQLNLAMDDCLPLKQREIVKLRVAWDGGEPWTFDAIGELYNIDKQGASYNFDKATWRIRRGCWGREQIRQKQTEKLYRNSWRDTAAAAEYRERLIRKIIM